MWRHVEAPRSPARPTARAERGAQLDPSELPSDLKPKEGRALPPLAGRRTVTPGRYRAAAVTTIDEIPRVQTLGNCIEILYGQRQRKLSTEFGTINVEASDGTARKSLAIAAIGDDPTRCPDGYDQDVMRLGRFRNLRVRS